MGGTERRPQLRGCVQVGGPSEPCIWGMRILAVPVTWSSLLHRAANNGMKEPNVLPSPSPLPAT